MMLTVTLERKESLPKPWPGLASAGPPGVSSSLGVSVLVPVQTWASSGLRSVETMNLAISSRLRRYLAAKRSRVKELAIIPGAGDHQEAA